MNTTITLDSAHMYTLTQRQHAMHHRGGVVADRRSSPVRELGTCNLESTVLVPAPC